MHNVELLGFGSTVNLMAIEVVWNKDLSYCDVAYKGLMETEMETEMEMEMEMEMVLDGGMDIVDAVVFAAAAAAAAAKIVENCLDA